MVCVLHLQNRVGELYSLVRFLRMDPHAYYFCRYRVVELRILTCCLRGVRGAAPICKRHRLAAQ